MFFVHPHPFCCSGLLATSLFFFSFLCILHILRGIWWFLYRQPWRQVWKKCKKKQMWYRHIVIPCTNTPTSEHTVPTLLIRGQLRTYLPLSSAVGRSTTIFKKPFAVSCRFIEFLPSFSLLCWRGDSYCKHDQLSSPCADWSSGPPPPAV